MTGATDVDAPATASSRRARRRSPMLTVGVAVSLALLIVVLATRPSADEQMADSPLIGKPAPPLRGMTIDSERSTSLRGGTGGCS
jgi:hypothetical protein